MANLYESTAILRYARDITILPADDSYNGHNLTEELKDMKRLTDDPLHTKGAWMAKYGIEEVLSGDKDNPDS